MSLHLFQNINSIFVSWPQWTQNALISWKKGCAYNIIFLACRGKRLTFILFSCFLCNSTNFVVFQDLVTKMGESTVTKKMFSTATHAKSVFVMQAQLSVLIEYAWFLKVMKTVFLCQQLIVVLNSLNAVSSF